MWYTRHIMHEGEINMIRFRLSEVLADKAFREKRRIEWREVAAATGIHRTTLSRMLNTPGYNATTDNIDTLCDYFDCTIGDLVVHVSRKQ